ncbi:cupin domain-containing protein [Flammeovirga aprica]|uniref:Cupin domain-containing protein n=1 Tax=Flammeovirga aprica JL-4 TaxID=694437 RepID=A0A7X9RYB0_9BACT|nr:cupin domain-containing protein [Flammeovirga aprica]NME70909.1 cupin domain-containing protein [Flammeovirga aprica JL-4]
MKKDEIIKFLEMTPHPEGGYFYETYRSHKTIEVNSDRLERNASTAIYYLMGKDEFSTFHRLKYTEIWHHYDGARVKIVEITPSGELKETIVGKDFLAGEVPQYVIKGGNWFAARALVEKEDDFVLVGCTVAPGFEFEDFEIANIDNLTEEHPQYAEIIQSFKRD